MKRNILSLLFLMIGSLSFGQLNTNTKTNQDGSTVIISYHKNGETSTIETWDKDKRWGNIKGFNNQKKPIFSYELRKTGGHASVYLSYHPNGQVKKTEFSSMPDGGIQWERYIHEFDELGNQTSFMDLSMNTGRETLFVPDTLKTQKPQIIVQQPEVIECYTFLITNYQLVNETEKTVTVTMKANPNKYIVFTDTTITLQPLQTLQFNSTTMAQVFLEQNVFEVKTIRDKQKKEDYKFVIAQPGEEKNIKTYTWHILKKQEFTH